jgi:hypothetical protein
MLATARDAPLKMRWPWSCISMTNGHGCYVRDGIQHGHRLGPGGERKALDGLKLR